MHTKHLSSSITFTTALHYIHQSNPWLLQKETQLLSVLVLSETLGALEDVVANTVDLFTLELQQLSKSSSMPDGGLIGILSWSPSGTTYLGQH